MSTVLRTLSLLVSACILVLSALQCHARRRNLTEITYRFTNCGSSNHDGPRVNTECDRFYKQINSPIVTNQTLFQFEQQDGLHAGGQGFRLPRNDLYNITIAGARGGEGLCNFEYGLSGVLRMQVELTTDYDYLILVGHSGTSVCDVPDNAVNPICQQPRPRNVTEAEACKVEWNNWINEALPEGNNTVFFNGGGGGGGASMIWPRRKSDSQFTDLPIAIAPGGGGASAVLDYESLELRLIYLLSINISFNYPSIGPSVRIYNFHVNAHFGQYFLSEPVGGRGTRIAENFVITSGSGGGWNSVEGFPLLEVDGKLLKQPNNFAQGGFDCSSSLASESRVFTGVYGGYGGGGGGCGSGGGGGGYTGGHVVGNLNTRPGSGGVAGAFNSIMLPIVGSVSGNRRDGDGYVEIVSSNCECAGQCVLYPDEKQFECLCPNDTLPAEDERSCYQERELAVEEGQHKSLPNGLNARHFHLTAAIGLLSLSVDVSVEPVRVTRRQVGDTQGEECLIVLFGESLEQAVVSESIIGSGTIDTLSVITLDATGIITRRTDPVSLLQSPVTVITMVLLSYGNCSLATNTIQANISILEVSKDVSGITPNDNILSNLFNSVTQASTTQEPDMFTTVTQASTTQEPDKINSSGSLIGAIIGTIAGITCVVTIVTALIGAGCYNRSQVNRNRSLRRQLSIKRRHQINGPGTGTIDYNSAYTVYQPAPSLGTSVSSFPHTYESIQIEEAVVETVSGLESPGSEIQLQTMRRISMIPEVDFCSYNRMRSKTSNENWSYPRSNLTYMRELGEGQFGKVLLMKATDIAGYTGNISVAVKTLTSRDPEVIKKFMEEADLMKKLSHPNIVSLLGVIEQEEGEDSAPLMILEYMQHGDLHGFLVDNGPGPGKPSSIKNLHFYAFSYDIATGLEFLSSQQYVHRDIATRNCLVGSDLQIKIADFGLARGVHNKDYYRIASSTQLPVRWMAPESLLRGKFSSASDVWAYGVTIWEILTFGQQPLPDMSTQDIVDAAQNGHLQHTRPLSSPGDLWELVSDCHQWEVGERPSFTEIIAMELFNVVNDIPQLLSSAVLTAIPESEQSLVIINSGQL